MPLKGPHFVSLTKSKWYHCIVLWLRDTLRSNGWPDYIHFQYRGLPSESGRMNRRNKFFFSLRNSCVQNSYILYITEFLTHWIQCVVLYGPGKPTLETGPYLHVLPKLMREIFKFWHSEGPHKVLLSSMDTETKVIIDSTDQA
jgi:hypothetical protein